ncbi:MAG: aminopeptidase P family protein [Chloroflexaceae bacterium]|nr:aminopeptidase P family protein [Chloroflexaceae bacterium]
MPLPYAERLAAVRSSFRSRAITAAIVTRPANVQYLTGFTGSSGVLMITPDHAGILTDARYRLAAQQLTDWTLHEASPTKPVLMLLAELLLAQAVIAVGIEAQHLTVAQHARLSAELTRLAAEANPPITYPTLIRPQGDLVEQVRQCKHPAEVAIIQQAAAITDAALAAVLPTLHPEQTEREAAWRLEVALREHGADAPAFPIIVAAGRNAAIPHHQPGDTPLGTGQPIIIDMGARWAGYHADLTRTIVLGEPDDTFQQLYATVLAAQQAAIAQVQVGVTGKQVDEVARAVLAAAALDDYFEHGLGHGVGLDIHEEPHLGRTAECILQAGMIFSIEPGVYLPEWGGIRIEDLVLLHEDGSVMLSHAPK